MLTKITHVANTARGLGLRALGELWVNPSPWWSRGNLSDTTLPPRTWVVKLNI